MEAKNSSRGASGGRNLVGCLNATAFSCSPAQLDSQKSNLDNTPKPSYKFVNISPAPAIFGDIYTVEDVR